MRYKGGTEMEKRVIYKNSLFTQDTVVQLKKLASKFEDLKASLAVSGRHPSHGDWEHLDSNRGPTGLDPSVSAAITGREVYLGVKSGDEDSSRIRRQNLALLWATAIPLGFIPYSQHPMPGSYDNVFHYFGKWYPLVTSLAGAGRGEEAWPSFCAAATVDIGEWGEGRTEERKLQSLLYLRGRPLGPVDGIIGPRTRDAL